MLLLVLLQMFSFVMSVVSDFQRTPSNAAVVVGRTMRMECSTNLSNTIHWNFYPVGQKNHKLIYNGDAISSNFSDRSKIDNSSGPGHRDLVISNTLLSDGGTYECEGLFMAEKDQSVPKTASAQLIVLDSDPVCYINWTSAAGEVVENNTILMACAVKYWGSWNMSMTWSKPENPMDGGAPNVFYTRDENVSRLSSSVHLKPRAADNGALVTCVTSFVDRFPSGINSNATNTPNYIRQWNATLNVLFGPRNISIRPVKDSYSNGDTLKCEAEGNPTPTYKWRDLRTPSAIISNSSQLLIQVSSQEEVEAYHVECIAENVISGTTRSVSLTVSVIVTATNPISYVTMIMGAICLILLIVVLIISRNYIKGWVTDVFNLCRKNSTGEPDVLPNAGVNPGADQNHVPEPNIENARREDDPAHGAAANVAGVYGPPDVPLYAQINKQPKGNAPNYQGTSNDLPVYSEIKTNDYGWNFYDARKNPDSVAGIENVDPKTTTTVGRDGTIYMEMNPVGIHPREPVTEYRTPEFSKSQYASIDHTVQPPQLK